jgi:hypothetical protein
MEPKNEIRTQEEEWTSQRIDELKRKHGTRREEWNPKRRKNASGRMVLQRRE